MFDILFFSGVDVFLDCLSGNDFTRAQKCLKPMGRIIHIGIIISNP